VGIYIYCKPHQHNQGGLTSSNEWHYKDRNIFLQLESNIHYNVIQIGTRLIHTQHQLKSIYKYVTEVELVDTDTDDDVDTDADAYYYEPATTVDDIVKVNNTNTNTNTNTNAKSGLVNEYKWNEWDNGEKINEWAISKATKVDATTANEYEWDEKAYKYVKKTATKVDAYAYDSAKDKLELYE
jgi:hypothetical protein